MTRNVLLSLLAGSTRRLASPMLQLSPAVAMLTASPELRVEGVKDFDIEPGQR